MGGRKRDAEGDMVRNRTGRGGPAHKRTRKLFPWQQCFSHLRHVSELKIHAVLVHTHTHTLPPWIMFTSSRTHEKAERNRNRGSLVCPLQLSESSQMGSVNMVFVSLVTDFTTR